MFQSNYTNSRSAGKGGNFNLIPALKVLMEVQRDLRPTEIKILIVMIQHANSKGESWPSIARLCELCGTTKRNTICESMDSLERRGLLIKVKRGGRNRATLRRLTFGFDESDCVTVEGTKQDKRVTVDDSKSNRRSSKSNRRGADRVPSTVTRTTPPLNSTKQNYPNLNSSGEEDFSVVFEGEGEGDERYILRLLRTNGVSAGAAKAFVRRNGVKNALRLLGLFWHKQQNNELDLPLGWLRAAVAKEGDYAQWKKLKRRARERMNRTEWARLPDRAYLLDDGLDADADVYEFESDEESVLATRSQRRKRSSNSNRTGSDIVCSDEEMFPEKYARGYVARERPERPQKSWPSNEELRKRLRELDCFVNMESNDEKPRTRRKKKSKRPTLRR